MSEEKLLQNLLDELLISQSTPGEVCVSCPGLLPQVKERWRRMRYIRSEIEAMFPPPHDPDLDTPATSFDGNTLPEIPGYEVEAVLGLGGMGVVFRARHLRLNRMVALKMALAGAYAGQHERERFQREAEAIAVLRHPNVVQIYDIGESAGRPFYSMELIEGGTLAQKLNGTPIPALEAAQLIATLAHPVNAAHIGGIVHRDLKPSNVLLTVDGTPKISDFGIARRIDGEMGITRTGIALGTPSYMAPEQAQGLPGATGPAVDIYALGAILYEMLTGRPPFRAETAAETMNQLISSDPVPPSRLNSTVPRDLETVCLKCLRKEPALRYTHAACLQDDLQRFLRGEAVTARPERLLERLLRRVRRRPAFSAALGISMLLTVALIGGGAWTLTQREANALEARAKEEITDRAADADLKEMATHLIKSEWPEAVAARERAIGRLGDRGSPDLRRRLNQGIRELELYVRLDELLQRHEQHIISTAKPDTQSAQADIDYESVFSGSGLGNLGDAPEAVAQRVKESNIRSLLLAALDDWAVCTPDPHRRDWVLAVARGADRNPGGWRERARNPKIWQDWKALEEVVKDAPVEDPCVPLLLSLAYQLLVNGRDSVPFLIRIQRAHPNNYFVNIRLGVILLNTGRANEALRYFQAAVALRPDSHIGNNYLGMVLANTGRNSEAAEYFKRVLELAPGSSNPIRNLALVLQSLGRIDEAIDRVRVAIAMNPKAAVLHMTLGELLEDKGRFDESLSELREAVDLDPQDRTFLFALLKILKMHGRVGEAREVWGKAIETRPNDHDSWYGYAEFCLFLGQHEEYLAARRVLLAKFGTTRDPFIAERTSRACLLMPSSGNELRSAVALAQCAAAVEQSKHQGAYPYFQFAQGLAEYRQGHYDRAIAIMQGAASRVSGPSPRLVLAMALHKSERHTEASRTLAQTILSHDWRADQVRDQDGCIYHALRREAESMIFPNVDLFLEGKYQPQDIYERIAFLGVCQFKNRLLKLVQLYAEIFAAAPQLGEDFRSGHRFNAACAASLAGCGRCEDSVRLEEPERAKWRAKAREWLRADLIGWGKALDANPNATREVMRQKLMEWQASSDLTGLRDTAELNKLPADERKDCLTLWEEVRSLINR